MSHVFYVFLLIPPIPQEKWKLLFDLGLQIFDAQNKDTVLTENGDNPFVAFILIASPISLH